MLGLSQRTGYDVVSHNGSGVSASGLPLAEAQRRAAIEAARCPISGVTFEIQQTIVSPGGYSRRYFVREGSRWVPWDASRDADVRQPDWRWDSALGDSHEEAAR